MGVSLIANVYVIIGIVSVVAVVIVAGLIVVFVLVCRQAIQLKRLRVKEKEAEDTATVVDPTQVQQMLAAMMMQDSQSAANFTNPMRHQVQRVSETNDALQHPAYNTNPMHKRNSPGDHIPSSLRTEGGRGEEEGEHAANTSNPMHAQCEAERETKLSQEQRAKVKKDRQKRNKERRKSKKRASQRLKTGSQGNDSEGEVGREAEREAARQAAKNSAWRERSSERRSSRRSARQDSTWLSHTASSQQPLPPLE